MFRSRKNIPSIFVWFLFEVLLDWTQGIWEFARKGCKQGRCGTFILKMYGRSRVQQCQDVCALNSNQIRKKTQTKSHYFHSRKKCAGIKFR